MNATDGSEDATLFLSVQVEGRGFTPCLVQSERGFQDSTWSLGAQGVTQERGCAFESLRPHREDGVALGAALLSQVRSSQGSGVGPTQGTEGHLKDTLPNKATWRGKMTWKRQVAEVAEKPAGQN